jgi:uncharacterized protein
MEVPAVTAARLRHRRPSTSDADAHITTAMAARADPWPDAVSIRTDAIPDDSVDRAARLVRRHATAVSDRPA